MPPSPPATSTITWRGYVRSDDRSPWRLVPGIEAGTDDEAWALLLAMRLRGDLLVSWKPDPNQTKRPR